MNEVVASRVSDFGVYLKNGEDEILLPKKYVPENLKIGDKLSVFIYPDSKERLVASLTPPAAVVGGFAFLKVKAVTNFGAFIEWHPERDLLVPFREQSPEMKLGESYVVRIFLDEKTNRLVASGNFRKFLDADSSRLKEGEEVDIILFKKTDLGYKVVINARYEGLLYNNELYERVQIGDRKRAYIKTIRPDGKIDVSLQPASYKYLSDVEEKIMVLLNQSDGFLPFSDNTMPEEIYAKFGVSKKQFKKAIGGLFKEGKIKISDSWIRLETSIDKNRSPRLQKPKKRKKL